jgi:uncharacterized membrane protein
MVSKIYFAALVSLMLVFLVSLSSALTVLNIYLDEKGDAVFLGFSDSSSLNLPEGVEVNEEGEITGITSELTSKVGEDWSFSYSLSDSELRVYLPKGSTVKEISGGEIYLEDSRIVVFVEDSFSMKYDLVTLEEKGIIFGVVSMGVLLLVLVGLVIFFFYRSNRKKKIAVKKKAEDEKEKAKEVKMARESERAEVIRKVLGDRENVILENLKKSGKIKSSYLRKLCDIPKASFSRHLQELEKKGLIVRSGEGKNLFVELKEK